MWLNGDVVFEKELLPKIIQCSQSCMAVNTNSVGEEEIEKRREYDKKYRELNKEKKAEYNKKYRELNKE